TSSPCSSNIRARRNEDARRPVRSRGSRSRQRGNQTARGRLTPLHPCRWCSPARASQPPDARQAKAMFAENLLAETLDGPTVTERATKLGLAHAMRSDPDDRLLKGRHQA